jgi:hypothetical protein
MKKYMVVFGAISALLLMQAIPAESSPVTFGGSQYDVVSFEGKSWDEAKADVVTRLGTDWHLAVITSQSIQDFVYKNLVIPSGGTEYWLGGYQNPITEPEPNTGWTWVTGASWSYANWNVGEPNDYAGTGTEQYLGMWSGNNGKWNDEGSFGNITGYITESPVPVPAAVWLLGTGLLGLIGIRRRLSLQT